VLAIWGLTLAQSPADTADAGQTPGLEGGRDPVASEVVAGACRRGDAGVIKHITAPTHSAQTSGLEGADERDVCDQVCEPCGSDPLGILPKQVHFFPDWREDPSNFIATGEPTALNIAFRRRQQRDLEATFRLIHQTRALRQRRLQGAPAPAARVGSGQLRRSMKRGRARRRVRRAAGARAPSSDDGGGGGEPPGPRRANRSPGTGAWL
jgi:hypothetical protein